jgi:hypothetical protein
MGAGSYYRSIWCSAIPFRYHQFISQTRQLGSALINFIFFVNTSRHVQHLKKKMLVYGTPFHSRVVRTHKVLATTTTSARVISFSPRVNTSKC